MVGAEAAGSAEARAGALPLNLTLALGSGAADNVVPLVEHLLEVGDGFGGVGGDAGG